MSNQILITELAKTIQSWVKNADIEILKEEEFFNSDLSKYIENFLLENNLVLEDKSNKVEIPALLKSSKTSQRMRELAGIPHKGNFV